MHSVFAKIVSSNQRDWCRLLPFVTQAYNSATHSSSTFGPYYLMYLRQPRVPLKLLIEKPTPAAVQSTDEYIQQTEDRMRQAYTIVQESLKANFDRSKKRYDDRVKSAQFKVGDLVYYYVPRKHVGKNRKWTLDNRGPFTVIRKINDVNYVIQKSPTANCLIVHIDRLTKCHVNDGDTVGAGEATPAETSQGDAVILADQTSELVPQSTRVDDQQSSKAAVGIIKLLQKKLGSLIRDRQEQRSPISNPCRTHLLELTSISDQHPGMIGLG